MIDAALQSVVDALNAYLAARMGVDHPDPTPYVILDNISKFTQPNTNSGHAHLQDTVFLTLVNIEKEQMHSRVGVGIAAPPPQNHFPLKLYCLCSVPVEPYSRALQFLSLVIDFFHSNPVFDSGEGDQQSGRISVEQVSLSYEDQSCLWSMLGGRQLPSIMYRMNMMVNPANPAEMQHSNRLYPYSI